MTQVGNVYGKALYSLCLEENQTDIVLRQLQVLRKIFASEPDFLRLLASPALSREERCGILDDSFRQMVHSYVLNFLKILTEKGYIRHFGDCCQAFHNQYNRDNGILPVTATTAIPLTDAQAKRLRNKLAKCTGQAIELTNRVDPATLGGIRLDYDGKRLDGTVSHRLNAIRQMLSNTVL